jgi:hypothetical protein
MTRFPCLVACALLPWFIGQNVLIAADNHWTGLGSDSTWTNAANWSLGTAPATNDNVFIEQTETNPVVLSSSAEVASLTLGSSNGVAALDMANGALVCDGSATILKNSTLMMAGGLSASGPINNNGTIAVPADRGIVALNLTSDFQNTGTIRVDSNSVLEFHSIVWNPANFSDGTVFDGVGTIRFVGGNSTFFANCFGTMIISNTVEVDLIDWAVEGPTSWSGPGLLRWKSGGMFGSTFNAGLHVEITGMDHKLLYRYCTNLTTIRWLSTSALEKISSNPQSDLFYNLGCIVLETNCALTQDGSFSWTICNYGLVLVPSNHGTITLTSDIPFNNYGTIRVETNSVLEFISEPDGGTTFYDGTVIEGGGILRWPDYPLNYVLFCHGTMLLNATFEMNDSSAGCLGPTIWTGSGLFRWNNGIIQSATFDSGIRVEVGGNGSKSLWGACTNKGTLRWLSSAPLSSVSAASFVNYGSFSIESNCVWDAAIGVNNLPGGTIHDTAGQTSLGPLTNLGTLQLESGVFTTTAASLGAGGTFAATLTDYGEGDGFGQFGAQTLDLNGSLVVILANGFLPMNGSSFAIVTDVSRSGRFSNLSLPPLPPDRSWRVSYSTNSVVLRVVPPATVAGATILPNGNFQFNLGGTTGGIYQIQASTDLVNWVTIQSNGPFTGTLIFTDTNAAQFPSRFYRGLIAD